ncbi:progranulin [Nephila pilipes]|uniref:Progranulin n=1 Tax=Nephila pilipes TaxID=299642 RepID=A0A8X6QVZ1_NEPPI|nr:progranulin [Nephila pilipes]
MRLLIAIILCLQLCDVLGIVVCPDFSGYCHDGSTCCMGVKAFECCHHIDAVCCSDKKHCCPANTTCMVEIGMCRDNDDAIVPFAFRRKTQSFLLKTQLKQASKIEKVQCDAQTYCEDGSSCCPSESGEYACCDYPSAVCCPDKRNCCPQGSVCDVSGYCLYHHEDALPSFFLKMITSMELKKKTGFAKSKITKSKEVTQASKIEIVPCDKESYCLDGNTCCPLSSGEYGCCDFPSAVCCPDKEHCCPQGSTCNDSGYCVRGGDVLPAFLQRSIFHR